MSHCLYRRVERQQTYARISSIRVSVLNGQKGKKMKVSSSEKEICNIHVGFAANRSSKQHNRHKAKSNN